MSNPARTEEDITAGLMAVIQWAGNAHAAARALKESGRMNVDHDTLKRWVRGPHADQYVRLREQYGNQLEQQLANSFTDAAAQATEGARLAIDAAITRLEAGKDQDPARTAANLATVADKLVGKMLALSGRPAQGPSVDKRTIEQSLRKLAQMGVIDIPGGPAELGAPPDPHQERDVPDAA